ncbi:hypothetical protein [Haliangium sp.]|uniref:hypothetical protein n=1 Tax=Haliangium sp. TaxID=2663208 RepID=UPI003D117C6D
MNQALIDDDTTHWFVQLGVRAAPRRWCPELFDAIEAVDAGAQWAVPGRPLGLRGGAAGKGRRSDALARLDAWDKLWFPIIGVVLARHHPRSYTTVWAGLAQARAGDPVASAESLLAVLDALAAAGDEATATLARHGLSSDRVERARRLLADATAADEGEGAAS